MAGLQGCVRGDGAARRRRQPGAGRCAVLPEGVHPPQANLRRIRCPACACYSPRTATSTSTGRRTGRTGRQHLTPGPFPSPFLSSSRRPGASGTSGSSSRRTRRPAKPAASRPERAAPCLRRAARAALPVLDAGQGRRAVRVGVRPDAARTLVRRHRAVRRAFCVLLRQPRGADHGEPDLPRLGRV